ncbi:hypothetical protein OBBRIDRAFT_802153 [Obba rivulosa]|uniref:Major facilitator superfamily (MFS) profile domain-containing protein n=1 Tax=Obba rivulosa TaxID=1052685 RepID=A0A8E2B661_9APHY|nr:hypothetical protein OBBRIDRAFT_802153 [Obba rivulosa]
MAAISTFISFSKPSSNGRRANRERDLTSRSTSSARLLNERRQAVLAEIDNAQFSWFHVKVAFVSGAGFFTDAIVATILGYLYGSVQDSSDPGISGRSLSTTQSLGVKIATPVGILVGQLLFGWLGDVLGHGVELTIMIIATFGQTTCAQGAAVNAISLLIVWRLIMGVGIGGDYPLSAVISSEFSSVYIRGRVMTAVFAN